MAATERLTAEQPELDDDADVSACGQPCAPDSGCGECESYWQTMEAQGLWDREHHRWTDKGWASITRSL